MPDKALTPQAARRLYDRIAGWYGHLDFFESRARQMAIECLDPLPGSFVLEVGVGSGASAAELLGCVGYPGLVVGLDISNRMLRLAQRRSRAVLLQADGIRLPFSAGIFDRLLCTYVLDLVPLAEIPGWLAGYRRVLRPGGRLVLVSLTEGVNHPSRLLVALWKTVYAASPELCGGCQPLQLEHLVRAAGFKQVEREVVVQSGVPSEVILGV